MTDDPTANDEDLDALVHRTDPDRWLSSRFVADPARRADLTALYAFDYELARAPRVASNSLLGEIRLTWWREVLDEAFGERPVRKHPTAIALADAIRRRGMSREPLEEMIDARYRELDPAPMNLEDAVGWARDTGGAAAVAAAQILDPSADAAAVRAGGQAWSIGRLISTAGMTGQGTSEALDRALTATRGVSTAAFPAIAHAALSRERAKGKQPTGLSARWRILAAVLRGRV